MEETNKETGNINEKPLDQLESFTENMAPPGLPLGGSGSSSFELVKKPYLNNFFNSTNDEGKSKGRDASLPPSDYIIPGSSNGGGDLNINGPMNSGKVMTTNGVQFKPGHDKVNIDMDRLKKQKRRISNQESAQRCRMRNAQYIEDMQQKVRDLQAQKAVLSARLSLCHSQNRLLRVEQQNLTTRFLYVRMTYYSKMPQSRRKEQN